MTHKMLARISRYLNLKETWMIFFMLGIIMMNYPFVHIFDTPRMIFGVPALFLYLFMGWAASICIIYLFVKAIDIADDDKGERT